MNARSTEPLAFGFLAGSIFFLIMLCIAQFACARPVPGYPTVRPLNAQAANAVRIEAMCVDSDPFMNGGSFDMSGGYGSGVLIDNHHVLTANHVIECPFLPDIHVITADGRRRRAVVDETWADRDVARLVTIEDIDGVDPVMLAPPPTPGEVVCSAAAFPKRGGFCGPVAFFNDHRQWNLGFFALVVPGNSGSGLYDGDGALVGIVTARRLDTELGLATSLWDIRHQVIP